MSKVLLNPALGAAMIVALLALAPAPAQAGTLIGETVRFQCPECGPPYDQTFLVTGGGPEITPFGQLAVDVEASSLQLTWLFTGGTIDPGHLILSDLAPFQVTSATLDPSSTYIPNSVSFTSDSVTIDFGGDSVVSGKFALIDLQQSVPEPSSLALMIAALSLLPVGVRTWHRRSRG